MDSEYKVEIQSHFRKSSVVLQDLENKIRENFDSPRDNIKRDEFVKVAIPTGYVRTADYFRCEYRLWELTENADHKQNLSYALKVSDLHNYIINRFQLFGVIQNLFIKQAIVNLFSVIEGMYSSKE